MPSGPATRGRGQKENATRHGNEKLCAGAAARIPLHGLTWTDHSRRVPSRQAPRKTQLNRMLTMREENKDLPKSMRSAPLPLQSQGGATSTHLTRKRHSSTHIVTHRHSPVTLHYESCRACPYGNGGIPFPIVGTPNDNSSACASCSAKGLAGRGSLH